MLKAENIICFSSMEWSSFKTSKVYLMEIFSRTNRVLYVESLGSRTPNLSRPHLGRIARRIRRWLQGPKRPAGLPKECNILVYSPVIIPVYHWRWIRRINFYILRLGLRRLIRRLKLNNPILWFYLPTAADLIGELNEKFCLYHCVDDFSTYPGTRSRMFRQLEDKLFTRANAVFLSNRLLWEKRKALNKNSYYLAHAVRFKDYQQEFSKAKPLPADIAGLKRPIVAMIGEVAGWIDWGFLTYAARAHPDWSMVILGPIAYDARLPQAQAVSNIYLLGPKPYCRLPDYYRAIDVCVVSFRLNEHVKYCTPTRFYEHLAAGKPVVSTDFPAAREFPEQFVKRAKTKEEFARLIKQSIDEDNTEMALGRKQLARENTWGHRAEYISEIISSMIK